ncbi:hypothetical protein P171DRAFT_445637 [Karstenula rhodostoma CBS 690.94]|uniref:Uncharacterized protein n=1 Tax=Karstenula rhodostoma CBS 690.94 TaxID=1392251 RepID=A0A9P4UBH6_9PLEO|nr:hypothetical protein P171DRAFT_445637 [Karstenula rhodostoma CBS 690.94]
MVAASSPFGISKAAIERRINNQIPRKRHTPYSVTKNTTRVTPKHVARPKPKPRYACSTGKIDRSRVPQNRPEKRGANRTRIVGTGSDGISQWSARRILASRPHPFSPSKTLYKVQWETTWEDASGVNGLAATEWKEAVHEGGTFGFKARDGSEWTVLKDATCLENDSEDSQWEMWRAIRRNAVSEAEGGWFSGLKDGEFVFASEEDTTKARCTLGERWSEEEILATNVLRATWDQVKNDSELLETDIPLGSTKVRFIAQIDPWMLSEGDENHLDQEKQIGFSVAEIFRALIPNPLQGLDDDAFSKGNAHSNHSRWCGTLKTLIRKVPFIFKGGTWLQLLAFLLLGSEAFRGELALAGIEVQDDWCQRAREYDMHMYYEQIVDNRAAHEIQETFLNLRDFFRDLESNKEMTVESG